MPQAVPINPEQEPLGRITRSDFNPPRWMRNPHLQTLAPYQLRRRPKPAFERERLELWDGDFLDLDWLNASNKTKEDAPLVLILHGLAGSSQSHYSRGLCHHLQQNGIDSVVMNLRGCSGEPNRLAIGYHSGKTDDVDFAVRELKKRHPNKRLFAIGFSLGGNILLKWLGEYANNALHAAIAASVPFDLGMSADKLSRSFSRLYQSRLIVLMQRYAISKRALLNAAGIDTSNVNDCKDFRSFDDQFTAPIHGFKNAEDYYAQSSSKPLIKNIRTPTLIVHSKDDPFVDAASIPAREELSPFVTLELCEHGGHVGFVNARNPFKPEFWLEHRVQKFILEATGSTGY